MLVHYQTTWPAAGLFCPLGRIRVRPMIWVWSRGAAVWPFREIDAEAAAISTATYESAAETLATRMQQRFGGRWTVRVGEEMFWAQARA